MRSILVVDDDPYFRAMMESFLMAEGYAVACLADGSLVLDYLDDAHQVDAILMDIMMPVMDGEAATRAVREWEAMKKRDPLPIIMVSAYPEHEGQAIARSVGADGYLAKPFKLSELCGKLLALRAAAHCGSSGGASRVQIEEL